MEPQTPVRVTLVVPQHNMTKSFEVSHAERLLMMNNNGGWALPENSKYTFDSKNGIRIKSTKRESEVASQ